MTPYNQLPSSYVKKLLDIDNLWNLKENTSNNENFIQQNFKQALSHFKTPHFSPTSKKYSLQERFESIKNVTKRQINIKSRELSS
jgi:hypothetical protein